MGHLLFVLVAAALLLLGSSSGALALDTTGASTTKGRREGEVDVFLRVESDNERGYVDDLTTDTDVTLADEDTSVVDRLGKAALEDLRLETALQEVLDLQRQHVIEPHAALVEHTDPDKTADERVTLEKTLGVLVVELEELTSSTTNFRQNQGDAPNFALVAETGLAGKLELGIETSRLERPTRDLVAGEGILAATSSGS